MLIDFHVHTFPDKLAPHAVSSLGERAHMVPHADGTVSDTEKLMAREGVDRFVALNIAVSPHTEKHVNDFAISLLGHSRIIPFGSVHPDSENAFSELKRLKDAGIRGIKFHNEFQNFFVDDEKAFPIYEECAKSGFIMLFHGGADRGFAPPVKAEPRRMRRVCEAFPEAKIVVAHLGGQDMQEEAIGQLVHTNAYIDVSFAAASASAERGRKSVLAFGADRVLFGSDCPWDTPAHTLAWLESMELGEEIMRRICSENALRLLGER